MSDDAELFRRYASENSEGAFAELVERHLGFVYHTALRQLNGNAHAAEDVAQVVFADAARKASSLARLPMLAGWLHARTRYAALQYLRTERRRRAREQEAYLMQELTRESGPSADWDKLRPVIDDALGDLNPGDREAVLLRFFEGHGFAEVGARLELSEDGARSRVERALDKMQVALARRGITSTAGTLTLALASQAAETAPVGLAATVTGAVLSGAAAVGSGSALTLGALSLMKISTALLAGSLAANAILGAMYVHGTQAAAARPDIQNPTAPAAAKSGPSLALVYDPDPVVFLAKLRTAGVSDRVQRALIEAAIDAQFRAREEALLPKRPEVGWWQWHDTRLPMETNLALLDLRREKARLRQKLLGPNPADLAADGDNPIAAEKREMVRLITEDYSAMLASYRPGSLMHDMQLPADRARIELIEEQRKKDLAALLTPEELTAYEARTDTVVLPSIRDDLDFFDATPAEFEAIRNSRAEYIRGDYSAVRMQEDEDRVRAALGEARFEELDRSTRREFRDLQALLDRSGLPRDLVVPVYGLWKNIEVEAHRINGDKSLSREEGMEAMKQLAERTRTGILEKLGSEVGGAYLKRANWIDDVEEGSVVTFTPGGWGGFPLGSLTRLSPRIPGEKP